MRMDDPEDIGWAGGGRCSERFIDTSSKADTCRRKDGVNKTDKAEKVNHQLESIFSAGGYMVQMWMLITMLMRPLISWQREETDSETDAGIYWQTHSTHLLSPWGDVCNDQDRWIKYHFLWLWNRSWNLLSDSNASTRLLSPSGTVSLYIDWDQLIDSIETIQEQPHIGQCLII